MSILRIDAETTNALYNQITARHTIPGLTHELFLEVLVVMLAETAFVAGRFILGQLIMFQNHGDLTSALTACLCDPQGVCEAASLNMILKRYLFILENRVEDLTIVQLVLDTFGKTREQMAADLAVMYDDSYLVHHGLTNPVLAQQYKALVLDLVLMPMGPVVYYLLMIEPTGRTDVRKQLDYINKTYNNISRGPIDLSRISPGRRDKFMDMIYTPAMHLAQTRSTYMKWQKQILDYRLSKIDRCYDYRYDFFSAYLYYCYGQPIIAQSVIEPPVELVQTVIEAESLVVEV